MEVKSNVPMERAWVFQLKHPLVKDGVQYWACTPTTAINTTPANVESRFIRKRFRCGSPRAGGLSPKDMRIGGGCPSGFIPDKYFRPGHPRAVHGSVHPTTIMSEMKKNGHAAFLGTLAAVVLAICVSGCNYGGDHKTPHPPVNPAMSGEPSESDHTNTDRDDQQGVYGTETSAAAGKDDNAAGGLSAHQAAAPADSTAAK
jgi:hypothetical protein